MESKTTSFRSQKDEVLLSWEKKGNRKFLKFTFRGNLTEDLAKSTVENWMNECKLNVGDSEEVSIIWNCLEMKKYSPSAAKLWKKALNECNIKMDDIWLVTTSAFFRMGAKTLTMLTKYKLKTVSNEDEIT